MTLMLQTESHGAVEAGFYSVFTQYARLDEYAFMTSHFCKLLQQLAEHPTVREGRILGYDMDKFWQRQAEFFQKMMEILVGHLALAEAEGRHPSKIQYSEENQQRMAQLQSDISVEDDIDMYSEGTIVPVRVSPDWNTITIGDYRIAACHFARMAVYVANGGIFGWMKDRKPAFADPTLRAIRASKHPIYRDVKRAK